ncbi:hypothetical protein LJB93_02420 [Desulfovibrio sp. OttesenSCG-928-F07]|nr:hypothetical protein [Desulfovibrio sp. OttesenSCG-928-F07]
MKKLILTLALLIITLPVHATQTDAVLNFCFNYNITYKNYTKTDNSIIFNTVQYGGFTAQQVIINGTGPYDIELFDISKADITIAGIKAGVKDLPAFFSTINSIAAAVNAGVTEEHYMVEEEVATEGDCDGEDDPECGDDGQAEIVRYEVHNKNWALNLSNLLETARESTLMYFSVAGINSPTFSLELLELADIAPHTDFIDSQAYLTDMRIKNLHFTPSNKHSPNNLFRHEFKSVDFTLANVEFERLDFISFVHFLADITKQAGYITYRGNQWYGVYVAPFSKYFMRAPLTVQSIKNFDATIIENDVAVRVYNANSTGPMRRAEAILNSDLNFFVSIKVNPENLENNAAKAVFSANGGLLDMRVAHTRMPNTSDTSNPMIEHYAKYNNVRFALVDEKLTIDAPGYFEFNTNVTYANADRYEVKSRVFDLQELFYVSKLTGVNGSCTITMQLDNYIPVFEYSANPAQLDFVKGQFVYRNAGAAQAVIHTNKFESDFRGVCEALKTAVNGTEICALLEAFLKDPQSISVSFTAKPGETLGASNLWRKNTWAAGHSASLEVNGKKADVIMRAKNNLQ